MLNFLKKKDKTGRLVAPIRGEVVPLEAVSDPVFSQKMMGDGFAIIPQGSELYGPLTGTVTSIFPTKHAIGLKTPEGLEILLHMGIDTVVLGGEPFTIHVQEGQEVTDATLLATIDLEALAHAEKDSTIMVIITNMEQLANLELCQKGPVTVGTEVARYDVH